MTTLEILAVALLVVANGFFVAAEFALVKVRLSQIEELSKKGSWSARITQTVLDNLDSYLSACQLGITLASLALGWVGEDVVAKLLTPVVMAVGLTADKAHYLALPLAFVTITALHIVLGEQAPKILAIQAARATALTVSFPLMAFYKVFFPLIWLLNGASNFIVRWMGVKLNHEGDETHTADELRLILAESAAGGELSRRERLMMENVLDLEDKVVRQVMVPRRAVVFLNTRRSIEENLQLVADSRHTRFPLCDGDLDRVVGMVHSKDLLISAMGGKAIPSLARLARKIPFMAETMRLDVVLREFQKNRTHLAMVVDEFGTVSGMITFENVLEEIIGPIQDEFDRELPPIIRRGQGKFLVDGLCPVDKLVVEIGLTLPEEFSADTAGGLMVELIGQIPQAGEILQVGRHELKVLDAEPTRVRRIEVTELIPPVEPPARNRDQRTTAVRGAESDEDLDTIGRSPAAE